MTDLLIIGKDGQLGRELVKIAQRKGLNFVAYSKEELDVTDYNLLERRIKKLNPKSIINTTAYHVTAECEIHPLNAFDVNCVAVANMAKISEKINAKFVTYSTNYVFDGQKRAPYVETDNTNPLQMYGLSKLAGEIAAINQYKSGTYVIRTCGVYGGKGSRSKKGNYILKILSEAKKSNVIWASKKQIVNPTYAADLAEASLKLLNVKSKAGIYHLVNEGNCSWHEFASLILKLNGIKNVKIKAFKNEEENKNFKSPLFSALKNNKAKKLGIVLPSIEDGLSMYIKEIK